MRHFKKVLVTCIATAAVLAPTGLAAASSTQSGSTPVKSTDPLTCLAVCKFDVRTGDILSYNNIPISAAVIACPNLSATALSLFALGQSTVCTLVTGQTATITRTL